MKELACLCILLIFITSLNCSKKENNPIAPDVLSRTLFYDSFEENGKGSLDNWSSCDSSYSRYFSFSADDANSNGQYSLCIENDSISGPYLYRIFSTRSSSFQKDLILDFWAKGEGGTSLSVEIVFYGSTYGFNLLMDTDSRWRHVIDTLHDEQYPDTPQFDSLKVLIGGMNYSATGHKIFLDDFRITELSSQK